MLSLKPYLEEIEELEPGQTIRLNHEDCEAGEDTRRRLYITRTHADETKVLAYCHNCQQSGRAQDGHFKSYRNTKHSPITVPTTITNKVQPPIGLIHDLSSWSTAAKSWAYSRELSQSDLDWYGIALDPSTERVYIPRWNKCDRNSITNRKLVGYQLRSVHQWDQPKYLTCTKDEVPPSMPIHPKQEDSAYAIVVEDLVSAIHIIRATENSKNGGNLPTVHVNFGTKIDPVLMYNLAKDNKWVVIWLDNDNQHVINQASLMRRTVNMYMNNTGRAAMVAEHTDPKHYEPEDILNILDEVWDG